MTDGGVDAVPNREATFASLSQGSGPPISSDLQTMMAYDAAKKQAVIAYILWSFLGMFGAHNFYSDRKNVGAAQLFITLGAIALPFFLITALYGAAEWMILLSVIVLAAVAIWVICDAFLIPGAIKRYNLALAAKLGMRPAF